jgi:hypothetical protein
MADNSTLPLFSLQPETKEILLTHGKVAIVDAADYDWLNQFNWSAHKRKHYWYASRRNQWPAKRSATVYMHRQILGAEKGLVVDHIDGNCLNNTRLNLRLATHSQNLLNQGLSSDNTSGYKGVSWHKIRLKWQAQISIDGKRKYLGMFDTAEDAARAYDEMASRHHGEFARLNFE